MEVFVLDTTIEVLTDFVVFFLKALPAVFFCIAVICLCFSLYRSEPYKEVYYVKPAKHQPDPGKD
jgi:hypothetical protein